MFWCSSAYSLVPDAGLCPMLCDLFACRTEMRVAHRWGSPHAKQISLAWKEIREKMIACTNCNVHCTRTQKQLKTPTHTHTHTQTRKHSFTFTYIRVTRHRSPRHLLHWKREAALSTAQRGRHFRRKSRPSFGREFLLWDWLLGRWRRRRDKPRKSSLEAEKTRTRGNCRDE